MASDILDWICDHIVPWALIGMVVSLVLAIPACAYGAYKQSKSPTFTLYKNEWACTEMQKIPVTTYVKSGDVMIPITTYVDECHQWNRQP